MVPPNRDLVTPPPAPLTLSASKPPRTLTPTTASPANPKLNPLVSA